MAPIMDFKSVDSLASSRMAPADWRMESAVSPEIWLMRSMERLICSLVEDCSSEAVAMFRT